MKIFNFRGRSQSPNLATTVNIGYNDKVLCTFDKRIRFENNIVGMG